MIMRRLVDAGRVLVGAATVVRTDAVASDEDSEDTKQTGDEGSGSGSDPSAEPAGSAHASSYASANASIREVAKWLIGALAAVAVVMLAGVQISSLGSIPTDNPWRLATAGLAALVAVVAVVRAIYMLTTVLMVQTSSVTDLREGASPAAVALRRVIDGDPGFLEGRASVKELVDDYTASQRDAIESLDAQADAQRAADEAGANEAAEAKAQLERATKAAARADTRRTLLGDRVRSLVELDGYLKVRASFEKARNGLLWWSVLAAVAIIVFAWAANPPEAKDQEKTPAGMSALAWQTSSSFGPDDLGIVLVPRISLTGLCMGSSPAPT
jgi:hypothetical protein